MNLSGRGQTSVTSAIANTVPKSRGVSVPEVQGGGVHDDVAGQGEGLGREHHPQGQVQRPATSQGSTVSSRDTCAPTRFFRSVPVVDGAGGKVGVEDGDDHGRRVPQDGVIDHIQELHQLRHTETL